MRNKNFALVALALVAVATACAEKPVEGPAQPTRLQPVQARQMGQFEVTVVPEPEFTGPGMGRPSFPTVWTQITEGTDGVPETNPARTIQIASTANFAAGGTPTNGPGCQSTRYITTNVRLTNFYPERFVDPYVVITSSITGNELCNPGTQPAGGTLNNENFSAGRPDHGGTTNFINYVTPDQNPRLSLAGSLVDTGGSGGTPLNALWEFNYPLAQSTRFTIRGQVWGFPMPDRPIPSGGNWGGYTEKDANLNWDVIDNADNLSAPRVSSNLVVVCTIEPAADGTCPAPNLVASAEQTPGSAVSGYEAFTLVTSGLTALTVGEQYYVRLVNRWTNPGGAAVTGSFPYLERLRITGPVTPVSPPDGANATPSTQFVWTTAWPDPARVNNGVVAFQICSDAACATPVVSMPNDTPGFTAVDGGAGTWTFTTPTLSTAVGLTAATPYWWRARNIFAGREGAWSTPRAFTTP